MLHRESWRSASTQRAIGCGLLAAVLLGTSACGSKPPAQPTTRAAPPPPATDNAALVFEFVVLHRRWVEKFVPTPPAEVKAWSEAPENASASNGSLRQLVVRIDKKQTEAVAQKKAQAFLERVKKGEDLAKLARQHSDDTNSKEKGGEYEASAVTGLPELVRSAYDGLRPGEVAATLVRSDAGFHVIRKEKADPEQIERAYKKAKAPEVATRLGTELLQRLKNGAESRAAIAESVEAVLGGTASSDAVRPAASIVDKDRIGQVRLPAAAKAALETFASGAHAGDVFPGPAVDGDTVLVARASKR
jgi:hypothetical protein